MTTRMLSVSMCMKNNERGVTMYKTYRVAFLDVADNCYNEKLLDAISIDDIRIYMSTLGHHLLSIEEMAS